MKSAFYILLILGWTSAVSATEASRIWRMEPSGRMWGHAYFPHSDEYFTDLGVEILAQVQSPHRLSFYLFLQFHTGSRYVSAPKSQHIDPNYQYYQQGLGLSYNAAVPLHIFLHRDCNHMIDIADNRAEYWTTLVFGIGTLSPYNRSVFIHPQGTQKLIFRYFLGGGPVLKGTPVVIFDFNNPVTSESFGKALFIWPRWKHASLDLLLDSGLQTTWTETKWHGHIATELGFTLHAGKGGWRFYTGYRWRDTRWLRPIDQCSYCGLSFVF